MMSVKVRLCPECGRLNGEEIWSCVSCGATLPVASLRDIPTEHIEGMLEGSSAPEAVSERNQTPDQIAENAGWVCRNCGRFNTEGDFCLKCGAGVQSADSSQSRPAPAKKCPSCRRITPEEAQFCPYCGTPLVEHVGTRTVARTATRVVPTERRPVRSSVDWEYRDFVYNFKHADYLLPLGKGEDKFTPVEARTEVWQTYQATIMRELQKWLDQGWEPVGKIGPAAIELEHIETSMISDLTCLGLVVYTVTGYILLALFLKNEYSSPTRFVVQMRRQRQ